MSICQDCGCSFMDFGNMHFCPDCIKEREEKACATKRAQNKVTEFFNPQAEDPWAHRSAGMKCKTCMWFVGKMIPVESKNIGRCRRHAPSMNGYPVVFEHDWCGDHKVDETKI